jgi:hypothetical protein
MKLLIALAALAAVSTAQADSTYLGMYIGGTKIGYASYSDKPDTFQGQSATRSDSHTVIDAGLMGTALKLVTDSTTWTNPSGRPLKMNFTIESGGRTQKVDAMFGTKSVVVNVDNNGAKSHNTLAIPAGSIVDDPITLMLHDHVSQGQKRSFWVLDPMTVSFLKNDVKFDGPSSTIVGGKKVSANLIEVIDPRTTMRVFVTAKGDLVRVEGPMGIEMLPESKALALGKPDKYSPTVDLALNTSLKTDKPIEDPSHLTELKIRITGKDLSQIPSDASQTVQKDGESWIIDVHPLKLEASKGESIVDSATDAAKWMKPSLDIPSNSPRFRELAKKIISLKKDVRGASLAIKQYVYSTMQPNAGIGVLRDASEILATKEGVCRDYAILTTTLLRAAGIPSRVVAGLVNWDGTFYYHAWSEAWDGHRWIGIDSTTDDQQLSAGHVKLADGNVEDAFTFAFLEKSRIEVLDARH